MADRNSRVISTIRRNLEDSDLNEVHLDEWCELVELSCFHPAYDDDKEIEANALGHVKELAQSNLVEQGLARETADAILTRSSRSLFHCIWTVLEESINTTARAKLDERDKIDEFFNENIFLYTHERRENGEVYKTGKIHILLESVENNNLLNQLEKLHSLIKVLKPLRNTVYHHNRPFPYLKERRDWTNTKLTR